MYSSRIVCKVAVKTSFRSWIVIWRLHLLHCQCVGGTSLLTGNRSIFTPSHPSLIQVLIRQLTISTIWMESREFVSQNNLKLDNCLAYVHSSEKRLWFISAYNAPWCIRCITEDLFKSRSYACWEYSFDTRDTDQILLYCISTMLLQLKSLSLSWQLDKELVIWAGCAVV